MRYYEYAGQPFQRNATFIPASSLLDFYSRPDSGYCSVYSFDAHTVAAMRAQGTSEGLGRFSVYSDRLWIDVDAASSSATDVEKTKAYTRELTKRFQQEKLTFTVWNSGSKGFHLCIKITPMQGRDVPYSQLMYVKDVLQIQCDYSLYQHGRLLSNPGRLHPKTGIKKHKVFEFNGGTLLEIPLLQAPKRLELDSNSLTDQDLGRIALSRVSSLLLDAPLPGMRHTTLWSTASQCLEAGLSEETVCGLLCWANKLLPEPKTEEEVKRCVSQAISQLR